MTKKSTTNSSESEMVALSDAIISKINSEIERTGLGAYALLRGKRSANYSGLTGSEISQWISGNRKTAKRARLEQALALWKAAPAVEDQWMRVSDADIAFIKAELKRTGLSLAQVIRGREDVPSKLTKSKLEGFMYKKSPRFSVEHFAYLKATLASVPDCEGYEERTMSDRGYSMGRIALTKNMRDTLLQERNRSGVSQAKLLRRLHAKRSVNHLSADDISRWINGRVKSVDAQDYQLVLSAWQEMCKKPQA